MWVMGEFLKKSFRKTKTTYLPPTPTAKWMSRWEERTWEMWLYSILKREIMEEQRRESTLLMYLARRKGTFRIKKFLECNQLKNK